MNCRVCYSGIGKCVCGQGANDNGLNDPSFLRVPARDVLAHQSSLRRLAIAYKALGLSRRSILDFLTVQFIEYGGIAVDRSGNRINLSDIEVDEVFRTDHDPSERWLSDFLRFASTPPHRRAQDRVLPRLELLWLGLAVRNPRQAYSAIR